MPQPNDNVFVLSEFSIRHGSSAIFFPQELGIFIWDLDGDVFEATITEREDIIFLQRSACQRRDYRPPWAKS